MKHSVLLQESVSPSGEIAVNVDSPGIPNRDPIAPLSVNMPIAEAKETLNARRNTTLIMAVICSIETSKMQEYQ
jgi:hypothetical protein